MSQPTTASPGAPMPGPAGGGAVPPAGTAVPPMPERPVAARPMVGKLTIPAVQSADSRRRGARAARRGAALRRLLEIALVLGATAVAGWLFDGYFFGTTHRTYLFAAAALGALTAAFGRALWARVVMVVLVLLGPIGLLLWMFPPGANGGALAALQEGFSGLHQGWSRMMTVGLPATPTPDLLVLPVTTMWMSALAGVWLLRRPRARLAPIGPPLAAYLVALVLTASRTPTRWAPAALLLAVTALLVLVRPDAVSGSARSASAESRRGRSRSAAAAAGAPARRPAAQPLPGPPGRPFTALLTGAVALLIVTGFGVGAAFLVPDGVQRPPYDPRTSITPPEDDVDVSNPLMHLKPQLTASPPTAVFTIRVTAPQLKSGLGRVRVAALDSFDGAAWQPTGQFLRPGAQIPEDARVNQSVPATLSVRMIDYHSVFLPVAGMPSEVSGDGLRVAVPQGNLITSTPGEVGQSYQVQTRITAVDPVGVQNAVPDLSGGDAYIVLPSSNPPELVQLARSITASQQTAYGRLKAIEAKLRALPYGTAHPPGESFAILSDLLLTKAHPPQWPDSFAEQRASAFAVLARSLGFPTRVVSGYVLRPDHKQPDGSFQVMTDDAHAWPEVRLVGYGWVAFEPTDPASIAPQRPQDGTPPQSQTQSPGQGPRIDASVNPQANVVVSGGGAGGDSWWSLLWWLLLLIPLSPLLVVVVKAERRRRRRGASTNRARVLGAWAETRDRLQEAGLPRDLALTPPQVVRLAEKSFGAPVAAALRALGPTIDAAACSPFDPVAADVDRAWAGYARVRRSLATVGSPFARLGRPFDPRPLLVRRGERDGDAAEAARGAGPGVPGVPSPSAPAGSAVPGPAAGAPGGVLTGSGGRRG